MADPGLLERGLLAMGGRTLVARLAGWTARGRVTAFGGFEGRFELAVRAPDRLDLRWEAGGLRGRLLLDGGTGWDLEPAPRALEPAERRRLLLLAGFPGVFRLAAVPGGRVHARGSQVAIPFTGEGTLYAELDGGSGLPAAEWLDIGPGPAGDTRVRYADYRPASGVLLPHRIEAEWPDLPLVLEVEAFQVGDPGAFVLPAGAGEGKAEHAVELELASCPGRVFAVREGLLHETVRLWGIPTAPTESWILQVVVRERLGRPVEPLGAEATLWSGGERIKTVRFEAAALRAARRRPVARFFAPPESFHFRHPFREPAEPAIDRVDYTLEARGPGGERLEGRLVVSVARHRQQVRLRFPLRGRFLVVLGHEEYERSHSYERSQQFALDAIPLGGDFRPLVAPGEPRSAEERRALEVVAPAGGVVVQARDDVPDDLPPAEYLKLSEPRWAIGGNGVVIDHGTGELSVLFHLRHGSVRVRVGDRVVAGQVLGLVGSAGTPGYPHLHYHLQDGPEFLGADGLPAAFDDVVLATTLFPPLVRGMRVARPVRGFYFETEDAE